MESKKLFKALAKQFPKRFAKMNHDRVGLMYGVVPSEIKRIFLCLDFDDEVFEEAKAFKPDIIITHHPFIFGTKAKVLKWDSLKRELCAKLDEINVPVYSYHTNFDTGKGGMNDALANALGLKNIYTPEKNIMMRIGELENPMDVNEFAHFAKKQFNVDYSLLINKGKREVQKIGIIGGGGSRNWPLAQLEGCDIYISGDAPHYVRRDIVLNKYNYLDMPHEIEKIFMPTMKNILLSLDPSFEIKTVDHEKLPEVI